MDILASVTRQALIEYLDARGGLDEDPEAGLQRYMRVRYAGMKEAWWLERKTAELRIRIAAARAAVGCKREEE